jgi:hypothetical protein
MPRLLAGEHVLAHVNHLINKRTHFVLQRKTGAMCTLAGASILAVRLSKAKKADPLR